MIVILTALELEHAAVRAYLAEVELHRHPAGTLFDVGVLATHPGRWIALASIGTGNATSAALTERAIAEFQPATVMFVGIAGALRRVLALGDVVVATRVYGYHGGREADKFRARPRAWDAPHQVEQLARRVARSPAWRERLPETGGRVPDVHFAPIVAGEVVLSSTKSPLVEQIQAHYDDAVAVEMESAGVAQASHLNMAVPMVTVRGISDLVDDKEITDRQGWRSIAARNAAAFALALAGELEETGDRVRGARPGGQDDRKAQMVRNSNYAFGEVGAQIGTVHGNLTFGGQPRAATPPAPRDPVDDLMLAVVNAHHAGGMDAGTFEPAMGALAELRGLLAGPAPQDSARIGDAIGRLDTVLGGFPELRARAAALAELAAWRGAR